MMDEILNDSKMDRSLKIDKLEAILSAATLLPSDQVWTFIKIVLFIGHLLVILEQILTSIQQEGGQTLLEQYGREEEIKRFVTDFESNLKLMTACFFSRL